MIKKAITQIRPEGRKVSVIFVRRNDRFELHAH
jgi:hypothetical protein